MVDSKQALKENVEGDILRRIEHVKKLLADLRGAVKAVEDNSFMVKEKVQQSAESVQRIVGNRKMELTRQIDTACHSQITSLQEEIQESYLALGSLQSMLSNLDSFNHNELLHLNIPAVSKVDCSKPSKVEVRMNTSEVMDSVSGWKVVNSKSLKEIFEAGQPASLPRQLVKHDNKMDDMCYKPVSHDDPDITNFLMIQPKLPSNNSTIANRVDGMMFGQGADNLSIEQWLSRVKLETCSDDDFEVISIENPPSQTFQTSSEKPGIVIINNDNETKHDLSIWLKPKVKSIVLNTIVPEKFFIIPSTTASKCAAAYTHNPLKNRFVDFPCLREDPATWIPPKRSRSSSNAPVDSELSLYLKPKGIVPPEYFNQPTTFWLKKKC